MNINKKTMSNDEKRRIEFSEMLAKCLRNDPGEKVMDSALFNIVSAFESLFFYDALNMFCSDICDLISVYGTLTILNECEEYNMLYMFMKSKYDKADMYFPAFFSELMERKDIFRVYMYELLADLEEIISEKYLSETE